MRVRLPSLALALIALSAASVGRAGERQRRPVSLHIQEAGCLQAHTFLQALGDLGVEVRRDGAGEPARLFFVSVEECVLEGRVVFVGRVTAEAHDGRQESRTVSGARCEDVSKALAVHVAIAQDALASTSTPTPESVPGLRDAEAAPTVAVWPTARVKEEPVRQRVPGRRGAGGMVATIFHGDHQDVGARAYAATRVFGATRVGASVAGARESTALGREWMRAGGFASWGAPWNDVVAGFVGEVGAVVDRTRTPWRPWPQQHEHDEHAGAALYLSVSLVLQIPWRFPVRPMAALTGTWTPARRLDQGHHMIEGGLVWQAF